jgi:FkbM family methyltransferase
MQNVAGYWLPDRERRIDEILTDSLALGRPAYQHKKVDAAVAFTPARRVALDVGSHIGMWSMQLLRHGFQHIHAFDPDPEKAECYQRNLEVHTPDLAGGPTNVGFRHVTRYAFGLGERQERVSLIHKGDTSLKTHVRPDPAGSLEIRPLDDLLSLFDAVDFIKIDVEGFELFVVRGGERTIRTHKPVIVVEQKKEVATKRYGVGDQDAIRLLESWGYAIRAEFNGDFVMTAG